MGRIIRILAAMLLVIATISGCTAKDYNLVKEDGKYYIILNNELDSDDAVECILSADIRYASLDEMVSDLEKGNFTVDELRMFKHHPRTEDGKILAPNLDDLWEPIAPESLGDYYIGQCGDDYNFHYCFTVTSGDGTEKQQYVNISLSEKEYHDAFVREFADYSPLNGNVTDLVIYEEPERNATSYRYWTLNTNQPQKDILYTIEANNTIYYVLEQYALAVSEDIPKTITIRCQYQEQYLEITVNNLVDRPYVEWLSSFGVKPYGE